MSDRRSQADPRPATAATVRQALGAAAKLERYFKLTDPSAETADWQPVSLLYSAGRSPLDEILEAVRIAKGNCEPRVAASVFFQGYAARLVSPPLGCIATANCVPDLPASRLLWTRPGDEMIRLALTAGGGWTGTPERLIAHFVRRSFEDHLHPLAGAVRSRVRIASSILRDNAASALVNGLMLINERGLAAHALAQPELRGSGVFRPHFVRHSCCLIYRAPPGDMCGDCPISTECR